jgi:hypothetical protein
MLEELWKKITVISYIYRQPINMSDYRFDKTAFKIQSLKEADQTSVFDKTVPYSERLRQAYFLISQAYGFSMSDQPRLDRRCFSSRKSNS